MDNSKLKKIIEGALLAASQPLSVEQLEKLFVEGEERPTRDEIREALNDLESDCAERGYELKQVASGYRFQVRQEFAHWVGRLWEEKPPRYSRATLETLALIAYRQPITRAEIEEIRGVSVSSNIIKSLTERDWIRVVGHRDVPGKPAMYGTTRGFLDYFNLKSLDELPTLAELRDLDKLHPELGLDNPDQPQEAPSRSAGDEVEERFEETEAASMSAAADAGEAGAADADEDEPTIEMPMFTDADAEAESQGSMEPVLDEAPAQDDAPDEGDADRDDEEDVESFREDEDEDEATAGDDDPQRLH
ncbi:MAG: SMC-Scp complex subunit ScpB [Gammaproteobacteria bacterium]|nr:SMC-Scp complex subunit ScpB [Gammaproteobacteria bacterium]MDX5375675.1 SMC-Scp complex subunit ScpB [Gammaproteobacteria bacterium]